MKRGSGTWILVLGVIAAGGAVLATSGGGLFRDEEEKPIEGVAARRGPLVISEIVRGNLAAKNSLTLRNEIEGRTTILTLVDEGTLVEPGDVVVELDTAELADRLVVQRIAQQNAAADYTKAREQLAIQRIQNESDIAEAKLQLSFARMDLEKYTIQDGEWTHEIKQAEETIKLAEEELSRAAARLEWTQKLYEQGFAQGLELETDKASWERSMVELEQARRDKALKEQYGHKRKLEELKAAVETMERDVQKVEKQALARLADFEAGEASAKIEWELEQTKLTKIEEQLTKGKIRSPIRGMVVYYRENSRWGSSEPVQEGKEVHEREEIVSIPREGGMIVEASLHETVLKEVEIGQSCRINIDAIPGVSFHGRVEFVAVLADSNAWFANPNQRVYRSEISIENGVPEMRPGMSCSVEILVAELENVVYVPVQCVFFDGGETVAFVRKLGGVEMRQVEVGLDNSKLVEVKNGLEDGDIVLLSPPAGFKPKPSPIEEELEEPDELQFPGADLGRGRQEGRPGEQGPPQARGSDEGGRSDDGERGPRRDGEWREPRPAGAGGPGNGEDDRGQGSEEGKDSGGGSSAAGTSSARSTASGSTEGSQ